MGVTIITAGRGEGKTTFLRAYATWQAARGRSIGGVASLAVFEDGVRVGYDLLDLGTGRRCLLARIAATNGIPPTIGMYRFDEEAVAQGNAAIITAVQDGLEIVAVDEVGPLEFQGKGWTQALQLALVEATLAQQLIIVVRFSLVDRLSERFPSPKWALASRISPPWPALPPP